MSIGKPNYKKYYLNLNKKLIGQFYSYFKEKKKGLLSHLFYDMFSTVNIEKKEIEFLFEFSKLFQIIKVDTNSYAFIYKKSKEDFFKEFCRYYFDLIYSDEQIFKNVFKLSKISLENDYLILNRKSINIKYTPILTTLSRLGFLNYDGDQGRIKNILLAKKLLQRPIEKLKKSQKEFETEQHEKAERGRMAELFVFNIEREKLKKTKLNPVRVSLVDVGAGYDITSFEKTGSKMCIEVKSIFKGRFFWSENEINSAKKLGNEYYIYLISFKNNRPIKIEKIIQNPHEQIFINNKFEKKNIKDYIVYL